METLQHLQVETNGIKLHVVQQGPEEGELVILLHGFPDYWYGWRRQISRLADSGFRVWAPDQRGYHLSEKPAKVKDYRIGQLTADVAGLIRASGKEQAVLIGHDWGGIVAWRMAREYPHLIRRLIILNAPHEAAMSSVVRRNAGQLFRSSYIGFFQLRWLPEKLLGLFNGRSLAKMMQKSSRKGTFSKEDLEKYREAWSQPKAIRSMINWYRANLRSLSSPDLPTRVTVPTLLIWGARDLFLSRELARKSIGFCSEGQLVLIEEASHWVQAEEPEQVNELILEFIR